MIIYPAMDLMGGKIVRLRQGRFEDATSYDDSPQAALRSFAEGGAQWAHVVDLDGARQRSPAQHELIARLAESSPVKLQVGGGFRTRMHVEAMLSSGVERVVIGSLAVKDPALVRSWIDEFGADHITLSLDVHCDSGTPIVAASGWLEATGSTLWDAASLFPDARHLLLTDIGRDGMLRGPNFKLLDEAVERLPHLKVQASGGIASTDDLERLSTDGAIVGRAIWEGRFTVRQAISCACG